MRPGDDTTLLDYVDANALTLNGGSIKDTDGNDALLALPSPGTGGSLGGHNAIVIRTVPPHLAEVTPVGTYTANQTPSYAFSSDVAGTIVYGGSCGSPTVDAESGDNTVVFNALAEGTYGDCTITVTDAAGNVSDPLAVSSFTVDLHPPLILSTSPLNGSVGQNRSSVVTLSFTKALDPSTFGIADDNSNRYGTPVWNAGDTEVAISHATWTQGTLVTITVDASTVGGEPLNAPTSWSFTTAGQSHGSANPPVQPPETASIVCSFLPFDEIVQSPGETVSIGWTASGLGVGGTLLSYSTDDRKTWNTLAANGLNNTTYAWTVPQADGPVFLRLDCRDSGGAVLGSTEGLFSVRTETEVPEPTASESPPPAPASAYSPEANRTEAPTIGDDKSLDARVAANACSGAELLKTKTRSTVYYCGRDGTRYPFPDEPTYFSWYVGFENVRVIGDADMAAIPLGSNVTHRPGGRMVKLIGNDKVFAVSKGAVLHWLVSEDAAARAYGPHWNELIDDLPNDLFGDYTMGEPIQ